MTLSLELHSYDGQLNFSMDQKIIELDFDFKHQKVKEYFNNIRNHLSDKAQYYLDKILESIPNGYDPINKIHILDLLYSCIFITQDDFITELNFTLEEMEKGICIQGQTIRFIQLLQIY